MDGVPIILISNLLRSRIRNRLTAGHYASMMYLDWTECFHRSTILVEYNARLPMPKKSRGPHPSMYCACKLGPLSKTLILKYLWFICLQNFKKELMVQRQEQPMVEE